MMINNFLKEVKIAVGEKLFKFKKKKQKKKYKTAEEICREELDYKRVEVVKKPVVLKFRRTDGSVVRFKATKIVKKPKKVIFEFAGKNYTTKWNDKK